MKTKEIPVFI